METKQLITIVITIVTTEIIKRLTSFIADKLKTVTEHEKAKTIISALLNKFIFLVAGQFLVLCLMMFYLKIDIESKAPITNQSILQMMVVYSITLRVGYNTLRAIIVYAVRVAELLSNSVLLEKKKEV